jgi:hypothetical protein
MQGDISSLVAVINYIHTNFLSDKKVPLYGALGLFMPINNQSTGHQTRQEFYPVFERLVLDKSGTHNKEAKYIKGAIRKDRMPNKTTGKTYDPESKGWYVGSMPHGTPVLGVSEFNEKEMDRMKERYGAIASGASTQRVGRTNAAQSTAKVDPAGFEF